MTSQSHPNDTPRRLAIVVRGVVQGVGFRPFVYNLARTGELAGWVRNESDRVRIEVQGAADALDTFVEDLHRRHPPQATIDAVQIDRIDCEDGPDGETFEILSASGPAAPRPVIPADLATCAECLEEIRTPGERRYGYAFTNCTNCGPRWSIIERLPYDRPRTSMARFAMCTACRAEYDEPADRRFHAQPIACPACGPALRLLSSTGQQIAAKEVALSAAVEEIARGRIVALKGLGGFQLLVDATDAVAVARLRRRKQRPDRPLAVMIGSLDETRRWCDVSAKEAAALGSPAAPIVLLRRAGAIPRMAGAKRSGAPESENWGTAALCPSHPDSRPDHSDRQAIADGVAPGNPYLGVMLPYTPLHHLLMSAVARPLVCTSGNLSEEPMATTTGDAIRRLGSIADVILTHDRPIVRPVDDSLVRLDAKRLQVLRRARGYAPRPITLHHDSPAILATGAHLKNTVGLAFGSSRSDENDQGWLGQSAAVPQENENVGCVSTHHGPGASLRSATSHPNVQRTQVVLSPHVGNLDNVLSIEVHRRAIADLIEFFDVLPEVVACDLHPDYASTRQAESLAAKWGVPLVRVQHHHAHVAACMAEHDLQGPVLGLAFDGTGFGPDGTVWGGEALVCQGAEFSRVAHLRTFALPGGDQAVRQPWRSALGLLWEIMGENAVAEVARLWQADGRSQGWLGKSAAVPQEDQQREAGRSSRPNASGASLRSATSHPEAFQREHPDLNLLATALARSLNAPRTSSMGRLFDAVAVLCGLPTEISFEGQAAMALEFAADVNEQAAYPLPLRDDTPAVADWEPMVRAVLADRVAGEPVGRIAAKFHNALAETAVMIARRAGCGQVVLSGGCFQNALLSERVRGRLSGAGFNVYTHRRVPPGDGGIALGQIRVAALQANASG